MKCKNCGMEILTGKRKLYCEECSSKQKKKMAYKSSIKRMIRNREFIKNYKKGKQCEICGYNKHTDILAFHHRSRKKKDKGINNLMKSLKSLEVIKKEIRKCILLCPNCHCEIHLLERGNNKKWERKIRQSRLH